MKRFFIEEIKRDAAETGPVVSIKFKEDDKTQWIHLAEEEEEANVFTSEDDIHEKLLADELEEGFLDYLNENDTGNVNGLTFGEYGHLFDQIYEEAENEAVPLIRLLVTITRSEAEDAEKLIALATGKYVDEIEIPVSDKEKAHQEFLDDIYEGSHGF